MIKAVRYGWPHMEAWERIALVALFPLWGLVWCAMWVYFATPNFVRLLIERIVNHGNLS